MPIAALLKMKAKPGAEDELFERFVDAMRYVRTEPGNLFAVVLRDPDDPSTLYEFAIYRDQQAIEDHRAAPHSLRNGPPIQALAAEPFTARFWETVDFPPEPLD